jgi:ABC-type Na+ efflux pump permease subunit
MQFGYSSMALLVTASGGFMQSYFATWEEVNENQICTRARVPWRFDFATLTNSTLSRQLHTGSMILGYFNGPIEGLLVVALILILTGIYGTATVRCLLRTVDVH